MTYINDNKHTYWECHATFAESATHHHLVLDEKLPYPTTHFPTPFHLFLDINNPSQTSQYYLSYLWKIHILFYFPATHIYPNPVTSTV